MTNQPQQTKNEKPLIQPDETDDVQSDGEAHLAANLTDDAQEETVDEYGEYADNTLEPDEVLYGDDESDFDLEYFDNEDEWDVSQDNED